MMVVLSQHELSIAHLLGVQRRGSARAGGVTDAQVGKQSPYEIDIDGVVGELAFAKMANLCPDLTVGPRSGGADLINRNGKTIDVKTTRHKNGRLLATPKKADKPCDIYVLMIVDDDSATFAGWATAEQLFKDENLTDLGHGVGYAMEQGKLNKTFSGRQ